MVECLARHFLMAEWSYLFATLIQQIKVYPKNANRHETF